MSVENGIIIQARTNSSRLPHKILMPFYKDLSVLEIIINRIQSATKSPIVIATTLKKEDDLIVDVAKKLNVDYYRGSEENVLERFIKCAKKFDFSNIIRICSDNPFLDLADLLLLLNKKSSFDYICFSINQKPTITSHIGFWAEKVSLNALLEIQKSTNNKIYIEHVTNYIYRHPKKFKIKKIEIPIEFKKDNIRLTLDTKEDLVILKEIISIVDIIGFNFTKFDILNHLKKNPTYFEKMTENIKRNEK